MGTELKKLSDAASQGVWSLGEERDGYRYIDATGISLDPGPDENMQWYSFARFVIEMEDGTVGCGSANVAFVIALVNAYRAGRLVDAP